MRYAADLGVSVLLHHGFLIEAERKIVAEYSYGRQLGRIIDVLSELIDRWPGGAHDVPSVQRFAEMRGDIERIKTQSIVRAISELAKQLRRL